MIRAKEKTNKYLLVFHEWWGLNEYVKNESDNLYQALGDVNIIALDLYDGEVAKDRETAGKLMKGASEERIHDIIRGAINFGGEDAKFATIGWCFGGGWSMQAALLLQEKAVASVVYYGMPEKDEVKLEQLHCEVMGHFAEQDQWINHEVVSAYEVSMKKTAKQYVTFWYDAAHAFANPSNAKYDKENAEAAFKRSIGFILNKFSE